MRLFPNQAPPPPSIYFRCNSAGFSLIDIFIICDAAEKMSGGVICILNTLFLLIAVAGISLFLMKGDENGKSGHTTIRAWIKYIIVEIFRQISRGLNNVLTEDVLHLRHITRKYNDFLDII